MRRDPPRGSPDEVPPEAVRVWMLGGFRVVVGSRGVVEEGQWRLRKAASLVKLLALAPGHRLHREQLMGLLWPNLTPKAAANNLHHALHHARRTLQSASDTAYLRLQDERIELFPEGPLWVDVEAFEDAAATARRAREPAAYRAAVELYTGDLLPEDRYEQWVEGRRAELRGTYLALLLELAAVYEERKEYEPAVETLGRVVASEPGHEEAHVALMRLYAFSGQHQRALGQYERLREALSRELAAEPGVASRRLYQEILEGRFLPAREEEGRPPEEPAGARRHNLPAARTSFVGREREVAETRRLLAMTRLLTLAGAGGCGKTRLALEVANDLVGAYPDGVWLVELAGLPEGTFVPRAFARALEVSERPGHSLEDTLVDALKTKNLLLVVDNCEHLVSAAAHLAEALLKGCPKLRLLATSREALDIAGEAVWQVPSLSLPDSRHPLTVEELERYGSARLFLERARHRNPAFVGIMRDPGAVAEICRQLDGIPLAIELAAARVGVLSVEQISLRLEDSLKLLTAGSRTATARHQTLTGTMDWSYGLLSEPEKRLFERLSVFAGGWTLEAAEEVGTGIEEEDVLHVLSRLVDKSLVMPEAGKSAPRYRMLEPVRQYARERLGHSEEAERIPKRHAEYYLVLAERAERELSGSDQAKWLDRLETEHDNLRAALSYLLGGEEVELGLKLAVTLWLFWYTHGHLNEGREWLEKSVFVGGARALHLKAKALDGAGRLALFQGDYEAAKRLVEEAMVLFRGLEDKEGLVSTLSLLGAIAMLGQQDLETVPALHEEAMSLRSEIQDPRTLAYLLMFSGLIAVGRSDWEQAEALHEESLALFREIRDVSGTSACLTNLGFMALGRRDHIRAAALFRENLCVVPESDKAAILHNLVGLACATSAQDQPVHAVRLWGAAEVIQEAFTIRLTPMVREGIYLDEHLSTARAQLDDEAAWETALAEGREMTPNEAVEYALSEERQPPSATPAPEELPAGTQANPLTRREREVAALVAHGLTNRRIAEELVISEHTAATHIRNILKKLELDSRTRIAAWVRDRQPLP